MKTDRRNFLRTTGLLTFVGATGTEILFAASNKKVVNTSKKGLSLSFIPYNLELKHVFTLANSSRKSTPDVLTRIEFDGVVGYGEASMPPYLGESVETATRFLSSLNLGQFTNPFQIEDILQYVDSVMPGNTA
ncbi:MAG TPA: dipeptide epimerase, partial [Prolixibacteraceae bacterium]|nr:dipeptide epimerase [Prolixibacteraceae bacterium]